MKWPAGGRRAGRRRSPRSPARGWHSQVTLASGVSSATVRPLASIECRSIGTARSPNSQLRRVSSSSAEHPGGVAAARRPGSAARVSPGADLDPDVRAVQVGERVLVGDVVAEEQRPRSPRAGCAAGRARCPCGWCTTDSSMTSLPLVTWMSGPASPGRCGPPRRPARRRRGRRGAQVHRDAGRLDLQPDAGLVRRRSRRARPAARVRRLAQLRRRARRRSRRRTRSRGCRRGAPRWAAGTGGQVAQRPAGDHRDGRLRQRGQRPDRRRPTRAAGGPASGPRRSARACRRSRRRPAAVGTRAMRPTAARSCASRSVRHAVASLRSETSRADVELLPTSLGSVTIRPSRGRRAR